MNDKSRWPSSAIWLAIMFIGIWYSSPLHAEMVIVKPGVEAAPIVVAANASPRTRAAAIELADYIEKIKQATEVDRWHARAVASTCHLDWHSTSCENSISQSRF